MNKQNSKKLMMKELEASGTKVCTSIIKNVTWPWPKRLLFKEAACKSGIKARLTFGAGHQSFGGVFCSPDEPQTEPICHYNQQ